MKCKMKSKMKSKLKIVLLLSVVFVMVVSVCLVACRRTDKQETPTEKKPAAVAVSEMEFDLTYPSDIVFQITLNDASFSRLMLGDEEVSDENYVREGSAFTIKADYLSAKAEGEYVFSFVTTINTLMLKVKVVRNPKNPPHERGTDERSVLHRESERCKRDH